MASAQRSQWHLRMCPNRASQRKVAATDASKVVFVVIMMAGRILQETFASPKENSGRLRSPLGSRRMSSSCSMFGRAVGLGSLPHYVRSRRSTRFPIAQLTGESGLPCPSTDWGDHLNFRPWREPSSTQETPPSHPQPEVPQCRRSQPALGGNSPLPQHPQGYTNVAGYTARTCCFVDIAFKGFCRKNISSLNITQHVAAQNRY